MKITDMITELGNRYGKQSVIVHTEHHTQVVIGKAKHDIWTGKNGLQWKLHGMRSTEAGPPEMLLRRLEKFSGENTDLSRMRAATELCNVIGSAMNQMAQRHEMRAVFCDAGWKDGRGRISVVVIDGEDVTAHRKSIVAKDSLEAEILAIDLAFQVSAQMAIMFPIYSDCMPAITMVKSHTENYLAWRRVPAEINRLQWIPREKNEEADSLANMRKKNV